MKEIFRERERIKPSQGEYYKTNTNTQIVKGVETSDNQVTEHTIMSLGPWLRQSCQVSTGLNQYYTNKHKKTHNCGGPDYMLMFVTSFSRYIKTTPSPQT